MERLNTEARQWIFAANNADSPPDTLDLHGLYVKEALIKVEEAIQKAQAQNYTELKLIVGKGLHSKDHVAHIKPAVERLLSRCVWKSVVKATPCLTDSLLQQVSFGRTC